jgi:hypothetical protein
MNLYDYHNEPTKLVGNDKKHIITSTSCAYEYLKTHDTKDADYQLALNVVSKDAHKSRDYAHFILKGRFLQGELAIIAEPVVAVEYARFVLHNNRFPEAEKNIAASHKAAVLYADYVIKGPWPEGEDAISQNAATTHYYTQYVTHKPFPKGEEAISHYGTYSLEYATKILKHRFIKGEAAIKAHHDGHYMWQEYNEMLAANGLETVPWSTY